MTLVTRDVDSGDKKRNLSQVASQVVGTIGNQKCYFAINSSLYTFIHQVLSLWKYKIITAEFVPITKVTQTYSHLSRNRGARA